MNRSILMTLIGLGLSATVLIAQPAFAQENNNSAAREKCTLPPAQAPNQQQSGQAGQQSDKTAPAQPGTMPDLADCNGVLKAPTVGDRELVEPAPPVGDTPVIKPQDLPRDTRTPDTTGG